MAGHEAPQAHDAPGRHGVYREEALRGRDGAHTGDRLSLVIRTPSFLLLWVAVAVIAAGAAVLTAVILETVR
ncbi:hypothetical protein [Nonomuraea cavernae]|uniref:Uncharacterized protein n=1 Tax=Nonomuraea cavernae TaxID=2045107 RepID=A0A918DSG2_9ACTN|nr:hypothetical protein [Nonomuraea cavernae]MCA2187570.1 hypothetical protein [Nonomuraea cavernae]GGO80279.1 hypothetical protein GCM10012289_66570 [Nonomuraea cavernae]